MDNHLIALGHHVVPPPHPIESGTEGQHSEPQYIVRDSRGTTLLKALAIRVLEGASKRDKKWDTYDAERSSTVPPTTSGGTENVLTSTIIHRQDYYQERTAIQEFDGGFSRDEAEKAALLLWIHDHPVSIQGNLCAGCNKPITSDQEYTSYGAIRLHWDGGDKAKNIHCYKRYIEKRTLEAQQALGINNTLYS